MNFYKVIDKDRNRTRTFNLDLQITNELIEKLKRMGVL